MHSLSLLIVLVSALLTCAAALPAVSLSATCVDPPKRLEWRQLKETQKKEYLDAVLCLTKKEAKSGIMGAVHRYDDHVAVHNSQTPAIHWVGHFILWHRYFVATYEKALRDECGYTGGQPYWDWSLDAEPKTPNSTRIYDTAVFSTNNGFGGNGDFIEATPEQNPLNITGHTGGGCAKDGPFVPSAFMLNFPTRNCLRRDFIPWIMNTFPDTKLVQKVLNQPDYTSMAREMEGVPSFAARNIHGGGHFGVGGVLGTVADAANSPGDPLFFLHHGNLDRIYWTWQQKDLKTRLKQVGGPAEPFDYGGKNVTLEFEINMGRLAGNATLKSLLDTRGGILCYTY